MDTLDRFLVKEFLVHFFVIYLGLALFHVGIDFLSHFWGSPLPLAQLIKVYVYKLPNALQQSFPMACLMSTMMVLSHMSQHNEILALYAGGIGPWRLSSTIFATIATLTTLQFLIFDSTLPGLNRRRFQLEKGFEPAAQSVTSPFGWFWYRSGRRIYQIRRFVPEQNLLEDVKIYTLGPNHTLAEKIHAREARYVGGTWELRDGHSVAYPAGSGFPSPSQFQRLQGPIREEPREFRTMNFSADTMRLKEIRRYIEFNRNSGLDTTVWTVVYHERLAGVFTALVFVMLAIPYALRPLKNQGTAKSISVSFISVFIYMLLNNIALSIGKGGHVPPVVAAWFPNAMFVIYSLLLLNRR